MESDREIAESAANAKRLVEANKVAGATIAQPTGWPYQLGSGQHILQAINAVMNDVGYVQKGGTNAFHGYKYATEADTIAALRPSMVKHGLILMPGMQSQPVMDDHGNTHIMMTYTLAHVSGERIQFTVPGSGNDRAKNGAVGDKGIYKAMTGALKYALRQTFLLETGDDPEDEHEDKGTGTDIKAVLEAANRLMADGEACTNEPDLNEVWRLNHALVEQLRDNHPELFKSVRETFAKKKSSF